MLSITFATAIKSASGGTVVSESTIYQADAEVNVNDQVAAGAVKEIDVPVDVSKIVAFYIYSDQDVTVETNSHSAPVQSFALSAKKALWWNTDRNEANPLTTAITKLYFNNLAGAALANVKAGFLVNEGV